LINKKQEVLRNEIDSNHPRMRDSTTFWIAARERVYRIV
jgi:hypothetical protein